jgi:flagellar assembly protein FliH
LSNLISNHVNNIHEQKKVKLDSDQRLIKAGTFQTVQDSDSAFPVIKPFSEPDKRYDASGETSGDADQMFPGEDVFVLDDALHEDEKKHVIESANFQAEQILDQANQQAADILDAARNEAEKIRMEAHEEGMMQGIKEGNEEAAHENETLKAELQKQYEASMAELDREEEELEPKMALLIADLVEKITGVVCDDKKDLIIYLIDNALKKLDRTKNINIHVSREDLLAVNEQSGRLKAMIPEDTSLTITEDGSLQRNQCIMETDSRVIDLSLDVQLENLRQHIKLISMS